MSSAPPTPAPGTPPLAGRFEILGALGAGGMGTVYRARDLQLKREVALKVLRGQGELPVERFRREGQIAANLQHPGIVRVFSTGVAEGRPWLAYELVLEARTLSEAGAGRELRERVQLLRETAEALAHAHAQGVVHRDVKPENVLVDAEGRVRVTDFGLALDLDSERLTKTGAIVGTPFYMAPEQIRGEREEVSPATDVWGLGVMLYETLAGALPFEGSSLIELAGKINEARFPPLPTGAPEPLVRVTRGALQRDPRARYASAAEFAEDLGAWLEGRPLSSVGAAGSARRAPRWPLALALGAGALLLALGALAFSAPEQGAPPTPRETRPAQPTPRDPSPRETLSAILARAPHARPALLRALLRRVDSGPVARDAREELRRLGRAPLRVLSQPGRKRLVYAYALVRPGEELVTSSRDGILRWSLDQREPLELRTPASGVAPTHGGGAFVGGAAGELLELQGETLAEARVHAFGGGAIGRIASDERSQLLAIAQRERLSVWARGGEGDYVSRFRLDCPFEVTGLGMDSAGTWLAVCGGNRVDTLLGVPAGFLWLLDLEGQVRWKKTLPPRPEVLVRVGETLYVGTTLGRILRYDLAGRSLPDLVAPRETSTRSEESEFRPEIAHGSTLRDLRLAGPRRLLSLSGGPGVGGDVSELRLWERGPEEGSEYRHLGCLEIRGACGVNLAVDPERGLVYVGTRRGRIQVWSMEAVLGQRTYNAKGDDETGRRTRGS